jgi:IS5 family transposase
MRAKIAQRLLLTPRFTEHKRARLLAAISAILDARPELVALVHKDLVAGVRADLGRGGLGAEQVLRILVIQRVLKVTFEDLEYEINDSDNNWNFCRLGGDRLVKRSRIHANIHKVTPETLEILYQAVAKVGIDEGVEDLDKTRTDGTVIETNIHAPTDSSLLWDSTRRLTRLMEKCAAVLTAEFEDRRREAKRAYVAAATSANEEERRPHYETLVTLTKGAVADAERVAGEIKKASESKHARRLMNRLSAVAAIALDVINQTERRVFQGKKVPSPQKVVSIFEPHTDVIVKDRKEVYFGHKVTLTTGASGLVHDCVVEDGNAADVTLAVRSVQRIKAAYGQTPRQVAFDGGYASKENLSAIKAEGVQDVAFSKGRGLKVKDMVKDPEDYPRLRNFRAGVENGISYLKRAVGLGRCVWKGLVGFRAYVFGGVLVANLLTLARQHLG